MDIRSVAGDSSGYIICWFSEDILKICQSIFCSFTNNLFIVFPTYHTESEQVVGESWPINKRKLESYIWKRMKFRGRAVEKQNGMNYAENNAGTDLLGQIEIIAAKEIEISQ